MNNYIKEGKMTDADLARRVKHWRSKHKGTGIGYGHVLGQVAVHMKEMGWEKSFKEIANIAVELGKKRKVESVNEANVWVNPGIEKRLKTKGFDIPKYPKTGLVTWNGKQIGSIDNFNGLTIYSKSALKAIKKAVPNIGIWNPTKDMSMEGGPGSGKPKDDTRGSSDDAWDDEEGRAKPKGKTDADAWGDDEEAKAQAFKDMEDEFEDLEEGTKAFLSYREMKEALNVAIYGIKKMRKFIDDAPYNPKFAMITKELYKWEIDLEKKWRRVVPQIAKISKDKMLESSKESKELLKDWMIMERRNNWLGEAKATDLVKLYKSAEKDLTTYTNKINRIKRELSTSAFGSIQTKMTSLSKDVDKVKKAVIKGIADYKKAGKLESVTEWKKFRGKMSYGSKANIYGIEFRKSPKDRKFKKASLTMSSSQGLKGHRNMTMAILKKAEKLKKQSKWAEYRITVNDQPYMAGLGSKRFTKYAKPHINDSVDCCDNCKEGKQCCSVHESVEPKGNMAKIFKIVKDKQHAKIGGMLVDMFSASALVKIFDAVNDSNKQKLNKMPISKLAYVLSKAFKDKVVV